MMDSCIRTSASPAVRVSAATVLPIDRNIDNRHPASFHNPLLFRAFVAIRFIGSRLESEAQEKWHESTSGRSGGDQCVHDVSRRSIRAAGNELGREISGAAAIFE